RLVEGNDVFVFLVKKHEADVAAVDRSGHQQPGHLARVDLSRAGANDTRRQRWIDDGRDLRITGLAETGKVAEGTNRIEALIHRRCLIVGEPDEVAGITLVPEL